MAALAGYLVKSPPLHKATTVVKTFKRRYFELDDETPFLRYYASKEEATPPNKKGEIDMHQATAILTGVAWAGPHPEEHAHSFVIRTAGGREYHLAAESAEDLARWVETLKTRFGDYFEQSNAEV